MQKWKASESLVSMLHHTDAMVGVSENAVVPQHPSLPAAATTTSLWTFTSQKGMEWGLRKPLQQLHNFQAKEELQLAVEPKVANCALIQCL